MFSVTGAEIILKLFQNNFLSHVATV